VLGTTYKTLTLSNGTYALTLPVDDYNLEVSAAGYLTQTIPVTISTTTPATKNVTLAMTSSTWNYANDFSLASNPSGCWTYGFVNAYWAEDPGRFRPFATSGTNSQIDRWYSGNPDCYGQCNKNNSTIDPFDQTWRYWEPSQACLYGGWSGADGNGTFARWIAPTNGVVSINARFTGQDTNAAGGTNAIVRVWKRHSNTYHTGTAGDPLFNGHVVGFYGTADYNYYDRSGVSPEQAYSGVVGVARGDIIDFFAGSSDGSINWLVGLDAAVSISSGTQMAKISDVKGAQDGTIVEITSPKVVTAAFGTFADSVYYIEESDRSSGIKVVGYVGQPALALGDRITLIGTVRTDANTERYIEINAITGVTSGDALAPVGMINKPVSLGSGLNVVGLLARIWGNVTVKEETGLYIYVDDGSGLTDGENAGVKVLLSGISGAIDPIPEVGAHIAITGLVGLENGKLIIRPRGNDDLTSF